MEKKGRFGDVQLMRVEKDFSGLQSPQWAIVLLPD
jgi:hypothetical protein